MQIKSAPFVIKTTLMFGFLAAGFSLMGLILATESPPDDPFAGATAKHIVTHIVWGAVAAFAALSFRYIVAGGLFAIALDADHFVNFLNIDMVGRMAHSIPFALLAPFCMMIIIGRRDFLLGAISFAAVFSHMSLDTFIDIGVFPIFSPFSEYLTAFDGTDWIILQLIAISAVIIAKLIMDKKNRIKKKLY